MIKLDSQFNQRVSRTSRFCLSFFGQFLYYMLIGQYIELYIGTLDIGYDRIGYASRSAKKSCVLRITGGYVCEISEYEL